MDSWLRQLQNKTQDDIAKKKEKKMKNTFCFFVILVTYEVIWCE